MGLSGASVTSSEVSHKGTFFRVVGAFLLVPSVLLLGMPSYFSEVRMGSYVLEFNVH
jgi:hypothetical protein